MKVKMRKLIFLLPILIFFVSGCGNDSNVQEEVTVPVRIYNAQPESLTRFLKLTGTISAEKDQVLFSKVSERIEEIYVKTGDRVNKDQRILKQYNAILSQGLEAAKANVANAEAQVELAEQNFSRMERLLNQRAISTQQFEQTTAQRKAAVSGLEAARAQLNQAQEQFENSIIKAPFSGVVAAIYVELNQMLPAGQQVAQVIDPSVMQSKVRVASKDIGLIKTGQEVEVSIPSIQGKNYKGKVVTVDRAIDPVSKTLQAEIVITNADEQVKSGMYGEFMIATSAVQNSIIIPETALLSQTEVRINKETGTQEPVRKYFLFTVADSNKAKLNEVKVGLISDGRVQITEGINTGDKVVVVGNNIVQEGQTVNIID